MPKARWISIVGFALSAALLCGLTVAEPPAPPAERDTSADTHSDADENASKIDERTLPQVTVEARRKAIEHQAYDFVRQVSQNPLFRDESLPRWNAPLCFAVAGLPANQGLYALGRLAD